MPLLGAIGIVAAATTAGSPGPTRTELLVVREDGLWRVPVESGRARRVPGTRGAVAAAWAPSGASWPSSARVPSTPSTPTGLGLGAGARQRPLVVGRRPLARVRARRPDRRRPAQRNNGTSDHVGPGRCAPLVGTRRTPARLRPRRHGLDRLVIGGAVSALLAGVDPDWSPDGRRIAFADAAGVATAAVGRDGRTHRLARSGRDLSCVLPRHVDGRDPRRQPSPRTRPTGRRARSASAHASTCGASPFAPSCFPDLDQRAPSQVAVAKHRRPVQARLHLRRRQRRPRAGLDPWDARRADDDRAASSSGSRRAGSSRHVDAGLLRYTWSSTHTHWHLIHFERYELRRARDFRLVGRDRKSGFCLADHYGTARRTRRPARSFSATARRVPRRASSWSRARPSDTPTATLRTSTARTSTSTGIPRRRLRARPPREPDRWLRERSYDNNAASVRLRFDARGRRPARASA